MGGYFPSPPLPLVSDYYPPLEYFAGLLAALGWREVVPFHFESL
jgi:hypothetical protein